MIFFRGGLVTGLSLASFLAVSSSAQAASAQPASAAASDGTPTLLTEMLFNSTTLSAPGWSFGTQNGGSLSVVSATSPTGGNVYALEGSYPVPGSGGQFLWAHYSVAALQTEDIYVEFWAQMPGNKEGFKFIKFFGVRSTSTNYADTTISTDYTGSDYGALRQVTFGDGTAITNDSQNAINLNGLNPSLIGRSYGTAAVLTPQDSNFASTDWGTGWHHLRVHVKFNSGTTAQNEVADGEYYLEIDGKVYADATGLFNRNYSNSPLDYIEFGGWAQQDPQSFQVLYYDIRISTGGFTTTTAAATPMAPTSFTVH